jgi:ABC-type sugar transport system substrate-binding protein
MANQKWDFVAIQPYSIDKLTAPVEKMIKAGVPVIDLDTLIALSTTSKLLCAGALRPVAF